MTNRTIDSIDSIPQKHLWECDHPYYCAEENYFGGEDTTVQFKSFANFIEDMGDSDIDMNLLFRWDWEENEVAQDDNYRNGTLSMFFMAQRKGFHFCHKVDVCRNDENAVMEFLRVRLQHLMKLWEGVHFN